MNEMISNEIDSKKVNLLSEFILSKINSSEKTQIQVVDCVNFLVVKGMTTSNEILNLNDLKNEFLEKFSEKIDSLKIGNTIDLIEYSVELDDIPSLTCDFHNNIKLNKEICPINSEFKSMISLSEFPYGYSNDMGKKLFYYAKHIGYNLQSKYHWEKLRIEIPKENFEENFKLFLDVCDESNSKIKSAILDSFDFNFESFTKKLNNREWEKPILFENYEFEFLKEINDDLVIV